MMHDFWSRDKSVKKSELIAISHEFNIVFVYPISVADSQIFDLLLITQNGFRIYISFETSIAAMPSDDEYSNDFANSDIIIPQRPTGKWQIMEIMKMPDQSSFMDYLYLNQRQSILSCGRTQGSANNILLNREQINYDSQSGVLSFLQTQLTAMGKDYVSDEFKDKIAINYIKRNESINAIKKQYVEAAIDIPKIDNLEMFAQT